VISRYAAIVGVLLVSVQAAASAEDKQALPKSKAPPAIYVNRHVFPWDCGGYGDWLARHQVRLFNLPDGDRIVDRIDQGETGQALDGETHTEPLHVKATDTDPDRPEIHKNDDLYLLGAPSTGGNGTAWKVWHDGQIKTVWPHVWSGTYDTWKAWKQRTQWWVKMRSPRGAIGWTDATSDFDGIWKGCDNDQQTKT
jgi:hypothetical protein